MISFLFPGLLFMLTAVARAAPRTFTDDLGVTHTFNGKPKIVTYAQTAIAFRHFGLQVDQLAGTYGERAVDSSDWDFEKPETPSVFPANPTPEEYQFLLEVPNLSPNCGAEYCQEFDMELFATLDVDVVVMHGYRQAVWGLEETKTQIENVIGGPVVYIDVSQSGPDCSEGNENRCFGKSMSDVIEQYEELAVALDIDILPSVQNDKDRMYQAAANFQDVARGVASRGVRSMAAYLAPQNGGDYGDVNYFANPVDDLVLRMLEELGLPLLHVNCNQAPDEEACPLGYFWETVATSKYFGDCTGELAACADDVMYPVDFWLYDHRTTLYVTNPDFKEFFPDKALLQGQMGYWPIGAGTISYQHAAEILELLAVPLSKAERIHPATDCTKADVSGEAHRTVGLTGGEFACFNAQFHNPKYFSGNSAGGNDSGMSTGAIVGLCLGIVAGMLVLALVFKVVKSASDQKQADTGTKSEFQNTEEETGNGSGMDGSGMEASNI